MTEKDILLRKISTYAFAIYDLHLFLDTHPGDEKTASKLEKYRAELRPLVEKYEKLYGPLTLKNENSNRYAWIQNPWPWEKEAN